MKRLIFLFIVVLFLSNFLFAQVRWGAEVLLGDAFSDADSISLTTSSIRSTMTDADVLYSNAYDISDREGAFAITFYADTISGAPTYMVYARLFYNQAPTGKHWGAWNAIFTNVAAMQMHTASYSRDGLSWWMEANKIQYKVVQAGTGQATIYLGDYIK